MRVATLLSVSLLVWAPLAARAVDAPHEAGTNCSNCHLGHNAPGGALTKRAGNFSLCQSCHLGRTAFGFDWSEGDQAVPGATGRSHSWSAPATNRGATAPSASSSDADEVAMAKRLDGGNLECSTCHDQHQADALAVEGRGSRHVSAIVPTVTGSGTMSLAAGSPVSGAAAKQYLLQIVQAGSGATALFKLSNDKGKSWFGCSAPTSYATYVATADPPGAPTATSACQVGPSVPLNDGGNVTVAFAGGAGALQVGDRWSFYVSYPFLRADNTDARMCLTCHRDRHQTYQNVEGAGPLAGTGQAVVLGTTVFSHPVGQTLNANARSYDRATPLDANGDTQAIGDGNASNDLVVGPSGAVTCLTCHHPHNADSNSLTVDPR